MARSYRHYCLDKRPIQAAYMLIHVKAITITPNTEPTKAAAMIPIISLIIVISC